MSKCKELIEQFETNEAKDGFKKVKDQSGYTLTHANGDVDVTYHHSFGKKETWITATLKRDNKMKNFNSIEQAKSYIERG
jgi:hypothetical protein